MIEVLIAALLVALVAAAVLTGYASIAGLAGDQRKHSQADAIAQQDEARMRGLTITQLSSSGTNSGNWTRQTPAIDGTIYTVQSTAQYISGTGATSCSAGNASSSADEVATTSTVSWGANRPPVQIHGTVTPALGGSLIATATTPNPNGTSPADVGLAGVTVNISGPSTVPPLTTDANGCAIFGGLTAGDYTVSFTPPVGYVDVNGNATFATQPKTVTATQTASASIGPLAAPGAINATFSTAFNGQSNVTSASDQFIALNTGMASGYRTFGTDSTSTNSTYMTSLNTGATMFPFGTAYTTFAGGCNNPPPTSTPGQVPALVTAGQTTNVTLPEPAMIVLPYTPSSAMVDDRDPALTWSSSGWNNAVSNTSAYDSTESDSTSTSTSTKVTLTFSGTSVAWIAKTASNLGQANVSLDGGAATTVDLYSSSTVNQKVVYSVFGLSPGPHTLVVSVRNTKNSSSSGYAIDIDAFEYGTPVITDDAPAGALSYSGTWNHTVSNASDFGGAESDSTSSTSSATFTFTGTSVQLLAREASSLGKASVSLDGGTATTVDLYSSSTLYQQAVYSIYGLKAGVHTLTVSATGTKNASSSGTAIDVDAFAYTPASNEDDRDTANGDLVYSGSGWTQASNTNDSGGTETDSNTSTGTTVTATFTGNAVALIAKTASNLGKASVSLDGGAATTVDLYSPSTLYQQTVYTANGLASGVHQLKITVTNTKNASSSGTTIDVDAILPLVLLATQPDVTVTDTDAACANSEDYPPEQVPTATQGALQYPGLPYGTYTVCVDDGSNHDTVTGFANTNYGATGNILNAYLYSGAQGYGSGKCT